MSDIQVTKADDPGSEDQAAFQNRMAAIADELGITEVKFRDTTGQHAFLTAMSILSRPASLTRYMDLDKMTPDEAEYKEKVDDAVLGLKIRRDAKKQFIAETGGFGRFDSLGLVNAEQVENDPPIEWLIDGMLEREALCMLVADSYVGKSYLALDWATCIASGVDWHGHKTESAKVLYLMMEGGKTTRARLAALQDARSIDLTDQGDYFTFYNKVVNFMDDTSVDALADYVAAQGVELVVIDTLSRAISGAAENSPEDMGAFVMAVSRIREANPHGSVLILHHTNKQDNKAFRGHGALFAAMDTVWLLHRENDSTPERTLISQKVKSGTLKPDMPLRFVTVGDSAVLEPSVTVASDITVRLLMGMQLGGKTVTRADLKAALMKAGGLKEGSANNRITKLINSGDLLTDGINVSLPASAGAKP